jgi:hypothetical protein
MHCDPFLGWISESTVPSGLTIGTCRCILPLLLWKPSKAGNLLAPSRLRQAVESITPASLESHMKAAAPAILVEDAQLGGQTVHRIPVAQKYNPKRSNGENPELFLIRPFRIFGLERPTLEEASNA